MARTKEFDREAVLDRAMRLFWRQGYEATSLQELVGAMGIGRQSLYDTFGDKHALFLAALDRYLTLQGAAMLAPLDAPGPLKPALRRVFDGLIADSLGDGRHGCLMVNATAELAPRDRDLTCRAEANLIGAEDRLGRAVTKAQAAGEVDPALDPRAMARYLFNAIQGLRVTAKATTDRATLEDIVRVTLSVLD